ncbi:hypothetical protein L1S34_05320 [Flavobacterium sp. K77]|uniref:hypothetical protein n=1 Tax=Flavobacterium sp. K77 TaxID=2910676 RepID=UPI001F2565D6|nr:hypothetical protein [Flavobacterium sp. K77]MCF6140699.1 hypothetical protein [Flavobacterium sp. K77]
MEHNFVFYIDDIFFTEGLDIETIKNFQMLFEVPLQVNIQTFYNKLAFQDAMKNIEGDNYKPRFKDKIKDVFGKFEGVENFIYEDNKININFSKTVNEEIGQFNNAQQVWSFINSKLPKRNFNPNYTKHGRRKNNGTLILAQSGESQLLTTDEESQDLLDFAIFDLRKRASFHVNFDDLSNQKYILFPDENTNENTFHAFHLDENLWNVKVPTSIRKYFNK